MHTFDKSYFILNTLGVRQHNILHVFFLNVFQITWATCNADSKPKSKNLKPLLSSNENYLKKIVLFYLHADTSQFIFGWMKCIIYIQINKIIKVYTNKVWYRRFDK